MFIAGLSVIWQIISKCQFLTNSGSDLFHDSHLYFSVEGGDERIERQFEKPDRERERERDKERERERERDRERDEGRERDRRKQRREDMAPYSKNKRGNVYICIIGHKHFQIMKLFTWMDCTFFFCSREKRWRDGPHGSKCLFWCPKVFYIYIFTLWNKRSQKNLVFPFHKVQTCVTQAKTELNSTGRYVYTCTSQAKWNNSKSYKSCHGTLTFH